MISLSKDFKHAHKLWSVWCGIGVLLISAMEMASQMGLGIAPVWKEIISPDVYPKVIAGLSTLGIVARFIKQNFISVNESEHADDKS